MALSVFPNSKRALAQREAARCLLGRCHAAECIAAQKAPMQRCRNPADAQAFSRNRMLQRQELTAQAARQAEPGSHRVGPERVRGIWQPAGGGLQASGSTWTSPVPEGLVPNNCSPHGGSAAVPGHLQDGPRATPGSERSTSRSGSVPDLPNCSSGLFRCRSPVWSLRQLCTARSFPSFSGPGRWGCAFRDAHKMHGPPSSSDFETD